MIREAIIDGNTLTFEFPYNPNLVTKIKEINHRTWNPAEKNWSIYTDETNIEQVANFIINNAFIVTGQWVWLEEILEKKKIEIERQIEKLLNKYTEVEVTGLKKELRPFQKKGVDFIDKKRRCILGDEQGLGKTVQAIAGVQYLKAYPLLIVAPSIVKYNWQYEVNEWLKYASVKVLDSGKEKGLDLSPYSVVIISYGLVETYMEDLLKTPFKSIVIDEFQYCKNKAAKRTKAIRAISKQIPVRIGLTGTMVSSQPAELIPLLEIIERLEDFGGWKKFTDTYCGSFRSNFGIDTSGAQNMKALFINLTKHCYLRRNKKEVAPEIPDKQYTLVPVDITNRAEYNRIEKTLDTHFVDKALNDTAFLKLLSENPDSEAAMLKDKMLEINEKLSLAEGFMKLTEMQNLVARGKLQPVADWVENFLASGEKLVVFTTRQVMLNYLKERFECLTIDGATPAIVRQQNVREFQENPEAQLIVINIAAGHTGITLTAASNVAFAELHWKPDYIAQAIDRAHRIGQKDVVNVYFLIANKTVDERMFKVVEAKRIVMDRVNSGQVNYRAQS